MDRLNREIRRRSNVVGVFPSTNSFLRFSASYLFEYQAEWVTAKAHRQYRSPRSFSSQFIALYSSLFFCLRCQNYTLLEPWPKGPSYIDDALRGLFVWQGEGSILVMFFSEIHFLVWIKNWYALPSVTLVRAIFYRRIGFLAVCDSWSRYDNMT